MNLDPYLLEILACPACKSPLKVDDPAAELVCTNPTCGLAYPVRDDIPVLLVDEARRPDGDDDQAGDGETAGDGGGSAGTARAADSTGVREPEVS